MTNIFQFTVISKKVQGKNVNQHKTAVPNMDMPNTASNFFYLQYMSKKTYESRNSVFTSIHLYSDIKLPSFRQLQIPPVIDSRPKPLYYIRDIFYNYKMYPKLNLCILLILFDSTGNLISNVYKRDSSKEIIVGKQQNRIDILD